MSLRFILAFGLLFFWFSMLRLEAQSDSLALDSLRIENEDERNRPLGDSTSVFIYRPDDGKLQYIDTTLNGFEYPNVYWKKPIPYMSDLGHLGTAEFPLFWFSSPKAGFRTGMDMFSNLRLKLNDIPFYEIGGKKPFTDLYYSQINVQHVLLRAHFAHQISPKLYYSIHYGLLNYNGYFSGQRSRHQDIALNFRYRHKKYLAYFTFINNANNQSENGGITQSTLGLTDMLFLSNQAVNLNVNNNGSPKHENRHQTLSYRHYLNNKTSEANSAFGHHFLLENNRYKYFDISPDSDSSFYGNFQTNNRGIRHYIHHFAIENELNWQQALGGTLDRTALLIKIYVSHSLHRVNQEPELFYVNNFAAGAVLSDRMNGPFAYRADLKLVNSRLGLDFWLNGDLSYSLKEFVKIGGNLLFQRYEPEQTARQFYISGTQIWDNRGNLKQTQEFSLQAYLAWPKFWGKFEIQNHTLSNAVYFDSAAVVRQMPGTANIMQFRLRQDLHIWKFHLENEAIWQRVLAGKTVFRLPEFILRHKLYFESKVFKTVKLRAGIAFRYMSAYYTNAYFPVLGTFHLQNDQKLSFYPQADVFLSVKIWQLRFFVNAENLTYYLNGWQNYYTVPYYPSPNWFVRFGASWQLFD